MSLVWLDVGRGGQIVPVSAARIDPADRGFTLGDGLLETMRVMRGEVQHLARHLARLNEGATLLELPVPAGLAEACAALILANGTQDGVLRLTLSRGPAARGLLPVAGTAPSVLITMAPAAPALPPARLMVSRLIRRDETSPLTKVKALGYLPGILARQEASRAGCDDALLLNTQGRLAEATVSSVLVRLAGRWVTPPVAEGALAGIARARLIEAGFVAERAVTSAELAEVEAMLLVNSLGARDVATLDGRQLEQAATVWRALVA